MTCGNHNFKNALYVPAVTLPSPGCPNSTNTKTIQTGGLERIGSYDSSEGSDTFEDTNVENTFSIVEKSQFNESIRTSSTSELSTDRSASLSSIGSETLEEEDVEVSFTSSSSSFTSSSRRSMKFENKKSRQVSFLEGSEKYKANNNEQLSFVMGMDDDSNNADGDFQNKIDKRERSSSLPAMKGDDKTTTKEDAVTPLPKITPTKTKKRRNSKKKVLVDTPDKKLIVTDDNIIVITPNKVVVAKKPVGGEKPKFVEMDRTLFQEDNSGQRRSSSSSSQNERASSKSSKSSISKKLFALDTSSSSNSATSVSSCIAEMGLMKRLSSTSSPTAILHHIATSPRAA